MKSTDLLLKVNRPEVSVEEFTEAAQALLAVVREVADAISGRSRSLRWVIRELRMGSAVLEAGPEVVDDFLSPTTIERIVRTAGEGMQALEAGGGRPPYFSDEALRHARRLASVLNSSSSEVGTSSIRMGPISITPTQKLAASVDELIVGKLKSIGTVEGVLVTVSKRDGFRFYVEDRVRGKRVECHFREDLLATVLTAFDRRVIVRGVVWSRKDGEAQRIEVRSFEIVEEDAKLPRVREMRGILRGVEYGDD
jgi:hypothetical protein